MKKALLIYPNFSTSGYLPIGIAILSSILKKKNFSISLFDTTFFNLNIEDSDRYREKSLEFRRIDLDAAFREKGLNKDFFLERKSDPHKALTELIKDFRPDIICGTATSSEFKFLCSLLDTAKKVTGVPTIVGGAHATVVPEESIAFPQIDMICIGEGEGPISDVADALSRGEGYSEIENLWVKNGKTVYKNALRPLIDNLDEVPYYDWDLFDKRQHYHSYNGRLYKFARFEMSRGCPYTCSYCINSNLKKLFAGKGKYVRRKSIKRAIEELRFLKEEKGVEFIRFIDEIFLLMPIEKLKEFAGLYKKFVKLPFIIESRAETIGKEKVDILKSIGVEIQVSIGVETGNERLRKEILHKSATNNQIINAYNLLEKAGLRSGSFNMMGFPRETRKEFFDTITINRKIKADVTMMSFLHPYEGTSVRDLCLREELIKEEDHVNWTKGSMLDLPYFPKEEMLKLRQFFPLYLRVPRLLFPILKFCEKQTLLGRLIYNLIYNFYYFRLNIFGK